jgi:ribokinase
MQSTTARVVVVGSSNTDMVVRAERLPKPGETVLGGALAMLPGGKGANQAVAAAKLGAQVTMVARVGADVFGDAAVSHFEMAGIETKFVVRDTETPSGAALIGVDEATGENAIIVAPGANARLGISDIEDAAEAVRAADVVICQLESPLETVEAVLAMAARAGTTTILNPAPAQVLPMSLLQGVSVLTPNAGEAAMLAGQDEDNHVLAAQWLRRLGAANVVVTLGARGCYVSTEVGDTAVPGIPARKVVDTTAAGDCFTGALAVALAEGCNLERAAKFANVVASLCVERRGAQPSLPTRAEVDQRLIELDNL